jgi:hypothetical protein
MAAVHRRVSRSSSACIRRGTGRWAAPGVHSARRLRHDRGMHLLATICAHGFGHLGQSVPVLNALRRRLPALRLTVASTLPDAQLSRDMFTSWRLAVHALNVGFMASNRWPRAAVLGRLKVFQKLTQRPGTCR